MRLNKELLNYLAGLFDGEGCLHISKQLKPQRVSPSYLLNLSIAMKHPDGIRLFANAFKGNYRQEFRKENLIYIVSFYGTKAEQIIFHLLPYLHVKRDEALTAIAFQKHIKKYPHRGFGYTIPKDSLKIREAYRIRLQFLNAKT